MTVTLSSRCACLLLTALAVISALRPAAAQQQVVEAQETLRAAFDAYNDEDYESFTRFTKQAATLNPHSVATRYYLARGYALTGQIRSALDVLGYLARIKVDYGYADHQNFSTLRDHPEFRTLTATLAEHLTPVIRGKHRYTIDQLGIIPEGIARDPATNRLFISSMRTGDIFVLDGDDNLSLFATLRDSGPMAAIGLVVDIPRALLWAVGATFEMTRGFDPDAAATTGAFAFDLQSGELRHRYLAGDVADFFNDLTLAADGTVFLTGSRLALIRPGADAIEALETTPQITGSNGVAVSPDGGHLFTSSYPAGVWVVERATGDAAMLSQPPDSTLYGIDGMYFYQGDLLAVQNGVEPWRLIRVSLSADYAAATGVRILEMANPQVGPTTGAIDGDVIHLVGQGPAPETVPGQFPVNLQEFLGKTVIYSVPID